MSYVRVDQEDGGFIVVEVEEPPDTGGDVSVEGLDTRKFDNDLTAAASMVEKSIEKLSKLNIDEVEFEFGMKAGTTVGLNFWAVTQATAEANFLVRVKWARK